MLFTVILTGYYDDDFEDDVTDDSWSSSSSESDPCSDSGNSSNEEDNVSVYQTIEISHGTIRFISEEFLNKSRSF